MLNDFFLWFIKAQAYQNIIVIVIIAGVIFLLWIASRREYWRSAWKQVRSKKLAMVCLVILSIYIVIGLLDSISWSDAIRGQDGKRSRDNNGNIIYEPRGLSILDRICAPLRERTEKTYSAPLATRLYSKETLTTPEGLVTRDYPRLTYGGVHLKNESDRNSDIYRRVIIGLFIGLLGGLITAGIMMALYISTFNKKVSRSVGQASLLVMSGKDAQPTKKYYLLDNKKGVIFWGIIAAALVWFIAVTILLAKDYHVLGTDKVGNDVLYRALKGVRTALIIGGFTTILAVPFAIFFGVIAGYFGGRIDDVVQYIYTTLASIPGILLIVAFMLIFGRGLFNLCLIMGITSWTGLCRLLRGETLKLRELEYIQAAKAFGVGRARIILRHIVPKVMHLVLISFLLRFSGLVLAEALLSYLQIGVEPTRGSWGSMIDIARMELAREPVVWWNLSAAFIFMVILVLSANLFGDAVRDALDPRLRTE